MFYFVDNYCCWPYRQVWKFQIPEPFYTLILFTLVFHIAVFLYERKYAWWRLRVLEYNSDLTLRIRERSDYEGFQRKKLLEFSVSKDRIQMLKCWRKEEKKQNVYKSLKDLEQEIYKREKQRNEEIRKIESYYKKQIMERRRQEWMQSLLKKHVNKEEWIKDELKKIRNRLLHHFLPKNNCVCCLLPICCPLCIDICCQCRSDIYFYA